VPNLHSLGKRTAWLLPFSKILAVIIVLTCLSLIVYIAIYIIFKIASRGTNGYLLSALLSFFTICKEYHQLTFGIIRQ